MISAGELRETVRVERLTGTAKDSFGEPTATWELLFTTRARVNPLSGTDLIEAQQVRPTASLRVSMRWAEEISDLSGDDRLVWENKILHIEGPPINVGNRDTEYSILCSDKGKVRA